MIGNNCLPLLHSPLLSCHHFFAKNDKVHLIWRSSVPRIFLNLDASISPRKVSRISSSKMKDGKWTTTVPPLPASWCACDWKKSKLNMILNNMKIVHTTELHPQIRFDTLSWLWDSEWCFSRYKNCNYFFANSKNLPMSQPERCNVRSSIPAELFVIKNLFAKFHDAKNLPKTALHWSYIVSPKQWEPIALCLSETSNRNGHALFNVVRDALKFPAKDAGQPLKPTLVPTPPRGTHGPSEEAPGEVLLAEMVDPPLAVGQDWLTTCNQIIRIGWPSERWTVLAQCKCKKSFHRTLKFAIYKNLNAKAPVS